MRLFLSEYLTCGACSGDASLAPLMTEGAAMIRALASDAAAVPGWHVVVTWDASLDPFGIDGVDVRAVHSASEERELFAELTTSADRTLVIAPECDGLLEVCCRLVNELGGRYTGPTFEAIALCSDKLALADHLRGQGVPTIETTLCDFTVLRREFREASSAGVVVKPRRGAGAVDTFCITRQRQFDDVESVYRRIGADEPIVQPYIAGRAMSIAAIVSQSNIELLPACRQRIAGTTELHYAGGSVSTQEEHYAAIEALALRTLESVPGLFGYVGIDLIVPDDSRETPVVLEINPRLTSSYHGYRRLALDNLAERILSPEIEYEAVRWRTGRVEFDCAGNAVATEQS